MRLVAIGCVSELALFVQDGSLVGGSLKDGSRSEKVAVQVLGANHKITTPKYRFEFIQTEAVG